MIDVLSMALHDLAPALCVVTGVFLAVVANEVAYRRKLRQAETDS